jgi:hypothetical protein
MPVVPIIIIIIDIIIIICSRKYLDLRGMKWREIGKKFHNENFIEHSLHHILLE